MSGRTGTPYLVRNTTFDAALVDLSNPEARTWIKGIIKDELIGRPGASGWMNDFGEALMFDASSMRGRPGGLAQPLSRGMGAGQPGGDR